MAVITSAVVGTAIAAKGARDTRKAGDKARRDSRSQAASDNAFLDEKITQARGEAKTLFEGAQVSRGQGSQAALDIFGQTIPQQVQALQGGNVGAQQALLAGLPQFQNAILGGQIDFGALQPQRLDFDPSFAQQQLPQFQSITDVFQGGEDRAAQQQQELLGGFNTNRDLITAASRGEISGLSGADANFFNLFLNDPQNQQSLDQDRNFLDITKQGVADFSQGTGLNTENKNRFLNLFSQTMGAPLG